YGNSVALSCGKGPDIEIALKNLAGVEGAIDERPALIIRRDGDRSRRMGHREAIRAGAIDAGIGAGYQHQVSSGDGSCGLDRRRIGTKTASDHGAIGSPEPNPRPEIIGVADFTDMQTNAVSRSSGKR